MPFSLSRFQYYFDFALIPVLVLAAAAAAEQLGPGIGMAWLGAFLSGAIAWTLAEYLIHRFVLHRLFRAEHFVHHRLPAAFVGPTSAVTVMVAGPLLLVLLLIFGRSVGGGAWAGILTGYLGYLVTHDAIHHRRIPPGHWLRAAFERHMLHHRGLERNFGVTTALFDRLFRTYAAVRRADD